MTRRLPWWINIGTVWLLIVMIMLGVTLVPGYSDRVDLMIRLGLAQGSIVMVVITGHVYRSHRE